MTTAQRETEEELGVKVDGPFALLGDYRQQGGKIVTAWSVEARIDIDVAAITSNTITMEWPPRSGSLKEFPEVDRAGWFTLPEAAVKILAGQRPMLSDFAKQQDAG